MIAALALLIAATGQAPAIGASSAPTSTSFSILVDDSCRRAAGRDVVVCGERGGTATQRLPLPDDRGPPDHAVPSNPNRTGLGALAVEPTPCPATQQGCTVGFGPPIMDMVVGAVGLVKDALADRKAAKARAADAGKRVPIPLD